MVFSVRSVPSYKQGSWNNELVEWDEKEEVAESVQDCNRKVVLFQPHHPMTIFRGGATQWHNISSPSRPQFHRPVPPQLEKRVSPSLEAQPTISTKSVQAPNTNSSSLNDMFTVAATIFQQIMTELSGTESEVDRVVVITRIVLKLI
jgi:hypothetical protein